MSRPGACTRGDDRSPVGSRAGEQRYPRERRRTYARNLLEAVLETGLQHRERLAGIAGWRGLDAEEREMLGVEAGRHLVQVAQGPDEQAGADHQDQRQRDLHDHQSLSEPRPCARPEHAAATLELRGEVDTRRA